MKKQFLILWTLCLIGTISVLPYLQILGNTTLQSKQYVYIIVQTAVVYGLIIFFGLKLAHSIKFKVTPVKYDKLILIKDFFIGIILAITIYSLDKYVFKLTEIIHFPNPALWLKLIASSYGAFNEEILMRLFLVSLLIKITNSIFKRSDKNNLFIYLSIVIAAFAFAAGHLPAMAKITELTPLVITRTLTLNGLGGIIFGWLYWRKSLTSAMIAHGTTDIVLAFLP